MIHKPVTVLKHHDVQLNGSIRLSIGGKQQDDEGPAAGGAGSASGQAQQARIVESNNEYAIIEIICSCGSKNHIQCNYAELAQSGSQAPRSDEAPAQQ